jgi:hypothetical protein
MMRYGRAGPNPNEKESKVNIHPRADAFFLGPRYLIRKVWWEAIFVVLFTQQIRFIISVYLRELICY